MSGVEHVAVAPEEAGLRLDRWFKRRYPGLGHGALAKMLRKGQIRLDGARAKPGDRLAAGQTVRVPPMDLEAMRPRKRQAPARLSKRDSEAIRSWVLYEDDAVLVLNKPPGIPTQGGSRVTRHVDGLLEGLKRRAADPRPRLVHRLDKDTSGVLCVARTPEAAAALAKSLRSRAARKLYWALVVGMPEPREGVIAAPLAKRGGKRGERMETAEDGQRAKTRYGVLDRVGGTAAWLAMEPLTGRTHQLRAHAAIIGHPIVGDGKYGGREAFLGGQVSRKLHLHARRLVLPHPDGGWIDVTSPLPAHMRATWQTFGWDGDADEDPFEEGEH